MNRFIKEISNNPSNPNLHFNYGIYALENKQYFLALAEIKTAETLGFKDIETLKDLERKILKIILPNLTKMNHNQYYRLKSLANEIKSISKNEKFLILDVGGGTGELAAFIPELSYCLVDPNFNGISGTKLPFPDNFADISVACHVLEHIEKKYRFKFLDQLLQKSKKGIILFNPFHFKETFVEDRLKLVIGITDAEWAKEHLNCSLPYLEDIIEYKNSRNLNIYIKPNGTLTTSLAFIFLDYFANKSDDKLKWEKINNFFNTKMFNLLTHEKFPTSYIVLLEKI